MLLGDGLVRYARRRGGAKEEQETAVEKGNIEDLKASLQTDV